jgi:hypothetical protein
LHFVVDRNDGDEAGHSAGGNADEQSWRMLVSIDAEELTVGIWACGTIKSKMACVILQSLTTQADRILSHFDDPQIGVMM